MAIFSRFFNLSKCCMVSFNVSVKMRKIYILKEKKA